MAYHPEPCSVSGEYPATIIARNGLRASPSTQVPRCLNLHALIASPHYLKLNGIQL
jgi:hypothetical protein